MEDAEGCESPSVVIVGDCSQGLAELDVASDGVAQPPLSPLRPSTPPRRRRLSGRQMRELVAAGRRPRSRWPSSALSAMLADGVTAPEPAASSATSADAMDAAAPASASDGGKGAAATSGAGAAEVAGFDVQLRVELIREFGEAVAV